MSEQATGTTRYQRVVEILDAAAEGSTADYGIGKPPWRLPLDEFREVVVYGVRMIAPPPPAGEAAGCGCGCAVTGQRPAGDPPGEGHPRHPGRGAASGLVKGLRGQAPFDGSVFPRLPWGGAAVADEDIRFISDWIDDGCPEGGAETVVAVPPQHAGIAVATIPASNAESVIRVSDGHGGAGAGRGYAGAVRQRVNLDCMGEEQLRTLREGFRELYALNKWPADRRSYNNLALIHQDHCQHGWERFLPWHRVYLYEFEQALLDVMPDAVLPYWDWTLPLYRPECPEKGAIIPPSYQAYLTHEGLRWLRDGAEPRLPAPQAALLEPLVGRGFASLRRFFTAALDAGLEERYTRDEHRLRFIDAFMKANPLWYSLRYPGEYFTPTGQPATIEQIRHYHYPKPEDIREILSLRTFRDFGGGSIYNDAYGFLDQNPHNTMHIWTGGMNPDYHAPGLDHALFAGRDAGAARNRAVRAVGRRMHTREDMAAAQPYGDMFSNLTASYDPIFWPIHVNVDRLWWEWQEAHPAGLPADLDAVLTPWSYTIRDTLDISRFGYEYVKSSHRVPIGVETPVGCFVSRPVEVPEAVRGGFATAEVRLHRVPQLDRSCFVRVFLNLPDANADTPIDDPHYAGYLAVFGHGECIGGPGHCAVAERRPFDLRPRSHDTPRNHRVNVTRTARALLEAGATRLQVTLVVIGADYRADGELLRLEGLSLRFLD